MRLALATALLLVPVAAAFAQQPAPALRLPTVQTPTGTEPPQPPALPVPNTTNASPAHPVPAPAPPAPATPAPAAPASPAPQAGQPPVPAPPLPNTWLPRGIADLVALDKVTARTTPITLHVGQTATFGSLTIVVRACNVRPPDQPADATAFLDITDSHASTLQFHGWMVVSAPYVSVLQHPIYDVRLAGCHD